MQNYALVGLAFTTLLWAQGDSLSIDGTVVDSQSGQPITHARISVTCHPAAKQAQPVELPIQTLTDTLGVSHLRMNAQSVAVARSAITDASGGFRFGNLPAGSCYSTVEKPGYTAVPGDQTGSIKLDQSKSGLRQQLARLGVITGVVSDQGRHPLRGINVLLVQRRLEDGAFAVLKSRSVTTADDGSFRLWNLQPGTYYLKAAGSHGTTSLYTGSVVPANEIFDSFVPVYSDGAKTLQSAQPLTVGVGSNIKMYLTVKLESTIAVRGSLQNFTGRETIKFELLSDGEPPSPVRAVVQADTGRFELREIAAGTYTLRATQGDKIGVLPLVAAKSDLDGITIALYGPVTVRYSTRFTSEAAESVVRFRSGFCSPRLLELTSSATLHGTDDSFPPMHAGQYFFTVECGGGYALSALSGSQDLLSNPVLTVPAGMQPPPIEIVASHAGAMLTAVLTDKQSEAHSALLVPQSRSAIPRFAPRFDNEGSPTFVFAGLPPGAYALYLFQSVDLEYRNPQFLQSLSGGEPVILPEGQLAEIALKGAPR